MKRRGVCLFWLTLVAACTSVHPVAVPTARPESPDRVFLGRHVEVLATDGYFEMTDAYVVGDSLIGSVETRQQSRVRRSIPLSHVKSVGRQTVSAGKVFAWMGGILAFMLLVFADGFRSP
jgi:hypothetical protein